MAFHEQFWVVTGTAAPVIALAAIVAAGESARVVGQVVGAQLEYWTDSSRPDDTTKNTVIRGDRMRRWLEIARGAQQIDIGVQAVAVAGIAV